MAATLSYLLISEKKIHLKNVSLIDMEILGLFVNTLTADNKYFLLNRWNLPEPIQMQLYKKQKTFCQLLSAFLKSRSNFKRFEKNDDLPNLCISEITDCERLGHTNV